MYQISQSYQQMDQDLQVYKIVVIGNSGTGKSNISSRYIKDEFNQTYKASLGVEFFSKNVIIGKRQVKITLWDTAGQQRFRSVCKIYYKGARGIIVVYDISDPQSYVDIEHWLRLANDAINIGDITVFIVGNKCDLSKERSVPSQRPIREYKEEFDVDCWEISAKTGQNVKQMFNSMIEKIHNKGVQVQNSVLYTGDSDLLEYSEVDKDSRLLARKYIEKRRNDVIIEYDQNEKKQQFYHVDNESKMTLANYDEMKRMEESTHKKKCCS